MASADFCILTIPIAQRGAVYHHFLSAVFGVSFLAYLHLGFLQTLPHGNALPSASNLCYVSQRYMEHLQGTLTP